MIKKILQIVTIAQESKIMNGKKSKRLKEDHGYMGKMSFPENVNNPSRTIMAT